VKHQTPNVMQPKKFPLLGRKTIDKNKHLKGKKLKNIIYHCNTRFNGAFGNYSTVAGLDHQHVQGNHTNRMPNR